MLSSDRFFSPNPQQKTAALDLYSSIQDLPIISPHGHVDPGLFVPPTIRLGNPIEVLIQPDHYILRMLVSQGITLDTLLAKDNPRAIWKLFADHFYLYRGTPSGLWLTHTLENIFGITEKLDSSSADRIFDRIEAVLAEPDFTPRALFQRMKIEVLATTDPVTSSLEHHKAIRQSGWSGRIIPTFRADDMLNLVATNWQENIRLLSTVSGIEIIDFRSFIAALEQRRSYFRSLGATATDTSMMVPETIMISPQEANAIFQRALKGKATMEDARCFSAQMVMEMARMSVEDGMVMQLHSGVLRNHNPEVFARFGSDMGFDIPIGSEFVNNLKPLLDRFGNHPKFTLILFTLDETMYSRELAPLAGAYPALRLGPPWWFHDSWNGMTRYFDQVMETAGLYNTVGFNDDTRSFLSIPARHDVWRRASANWLASLEVRRLIDHHDAEQMAYEMAVGLAKRAYHLEQ
ncbi:MAG: glucuronate isomerase [Leptolinea sp.]|jgi:glucuronate isomerase|nr:glucuronate isomerase [Leptolinea sp.]